MGSCILEKIFVNINGTAQGMFINGKNIDNPILLFIHGGPGMPEYPLTEKYPTSMDECFTVCWWEQRGASLSFNKNISFNEISVEQLVLDAIEVTNYLRGRFRQDKIFMMGHSFGSLIGLKTIKNAPELYHAYVGMAQISNQLISEQIAYTYMIEQYKIKENKRMIKKMEKYNILTTNNVPIEYVKFRDKPMHEWGIGTMHNMKSVISGVFFPIMKFSGYTFLEKLNLWKSKSLLLKKNQFMGNNDAKQLV
ncbi:MAG: alpha/beta hydrolase [Cystobacterineae bacterium]|nr:alpha/beta hydrolase [Cystobacterineae bacterium]